MATRNLRQVGASVWKSAKMARTAPYNYIGEKMPLNELLSHNLSQESFNHTNECRFGNDFIQQLNE